MTFDFPYIVICGPTASGKSSLAMRLAQEYNGEILSCDSIQFYKGFDVGSAKPSQLDQSLVPHHFIDILEPHADFDASQYATMARETLTDVAARGRLPIIVGGSGLFLRALWGESWHTNLPSDAQLRADLLQESEETLYRRLQELDPHRAAQLHVNDKFRVSRALEVIHLTNSTFSELTQTPAPGVQNRGFVVKIKPEREELKARIQARCQEFLAHGLLEEVLSLLAQGVEADCKPMQSIGYKQACQYIQQQLSREELLPKMIYATRQYAKRQRTWFNKVAAHVELDTCETDFVIQLDTYLRDNNFRQSKARSSLGT